VLRSIAEAYRAQRDDIAASAERMREALRPPAITAASEPAPGLLDAAAQALATQTDRRYGGFGPAPKFPHPMAVDVLLRRYRVTRKRSLWDAAEITLDRMARGGLHDQVGGGFHRYSVDGTWSVPHFEKMLYDNAQLAPVYLHAYQLSGSRQFLEVATSTLDYMARELRLSVGGFAASQDADTDDGEGVFFAWTPDQLRAVLGGDDGDLAARLFGVGAAGNFEHGMTVLSLPYPPEQVSAALGVSEQVLRERMTSIRGRLFEARNTRAKPSRDDKVVTAWNGLAIAAFAEAGAALGREDYIAAARQCAEFLLDALVVDGTVHRSWLDGQAKVQGFLEDEGHLADSLLTLYEATGEPRYFSAALQTARDIVSRFRSDDAQYFDTANDAEPLIVRPRTIDDNPVRSAQSAAASAFVRLHALTGDQEWQVHASEIVAPLSAAIARAPLALAGLACVLEMYQGPVKEIAIGGEAHDHGVRDLVRTVWSRFDPLRVLAWGSPDAVPLLQERPMVGGRAAAYVCEQFVCAAPITDASALASALET
jgi:uncharacterized protein